MSRIQDSIKVEQGTLVRKRHYTDRDAVLNRNAELRKADAVKPTDGVRVEACFPLEEKGRLAKKARNGQLPSYMADLDSLDAEIQDRATTKLLNSVDGRQYKVGGTSRKSFRFCNNPLAKDR